VLKPRVDIEEVLRESARRVRVLQEAAHALSEARSQPEPAVQPRAVQIVGTTLRPPREPQR
jgi:hypothetical protein